MSANRLAVASWCLAGAIAVILSASHLVGGPDELQAEADQSENLTELQAAAPGSPRQIAAGLALCWQERGLASEARWTADGDLICRASSPAQLLTVAQGGRP